MKCTVEMGSGAMICIPCFIKVGSGSQKLFEGGHREQGDFISIFFFLIRKVG
jgi:hypothetical protein